MSDPLVHRPRAYLDLREPRKPMATRLGFIRRLMRRMRRHRGLLGS